MSNIDEELKPCECINFQIALGDGTDWEGWGAALGVDAVNGIFNFSTDTDTISYCPWCGKKLKRLRPYGKCGIE